MGKPKGSITIHRYWRRHAVSHAVATRMIAYWLGREFKERTACDQAVLRADLGQIEYRANVKPARTAAGGRDRRASPINPAHRDGADEIIFHPSSEPAPSKKRAAAPFDRDWVRAEGEKVAGRLARLDGLAPTHPARRWLAFDVVAWLTLMRPDLARERTGEIVALLSEAAPDWGLAVRERASDLRRLADLCIHANGEGAWWIAWRDRIEPVVDAHAPVK